MKILFIVPSSLNPKQMYLEYPMGAGYICTYLKACGFETMIIDQHAEKFTDEEVINAIEEYVPDIIAFSLMTPNYPRALKQVNLIKEKGINVPIMAGGMHISIFKEQLLSDGFDLLVVGEGEFVVQKICLVYEYENKLLQCNETIISPNSIFQATDIFNDNYEDRVITDSLLLDRSVYNLGLYTHHSLLAARGCMFKCNFCCNYTKVFNVFNIRSVDSVIEELVMLEEMGAKQVFFADDIFFHNKEKIKSFCIKYNEKDLTIKWIAQLRVNTVDEDTLLQMKACGCQKICFGVESGSQKILDAANKKITIEEIKLGIALAKKVGIRVKTFWIVGLPGDMNEQMKSLELMLDTRPNDISIHQLIPFPGTIYYEDPEKYGIKINDKKDFVSFCYGGLKDNFQLEYMSLDEFVILMNTFLVKLEEAGYLSSDVATPYDDYIYSLPISKKSITVFSEKGD